MSIHPGFRAAALGAVLLAASIPAFGDDSELQALRTENARLKAELEQLRAACPAASRTPATPNSPMPAPAASAAPAATPPPGYQLVPIPPKYSETGCTRGLFDNGPDAPWKHENNWDALWKGMKPADVETLLGEEHFDVKAKGKLIWQYGKCGHNVQGYVVYENGAVMFWKSPDF